MEVCRGVDSLFEAAALLEELTRQERDEEIRRRVALRLGLPQESETLRCLELSGRIRVETRRAFADEMDDVAFYFRPLGEDLCPLAGFALPELYGRKALTVRELEALTKGETLEDRLRFLCEELSGLEDQLEEGERPDLACALRMLAEADLSVQDKWNVQQMVLEAESHAPKLLAFLKRAEEVFLSFREQWEPEVERWYAYWSERERQQGSVAAILMAELHVDIGRSAGGARVLPIVTRPNQAGFTARRRGISAEESRDEYRVGVLFGEKVQLQPLGTARGALLSQTLRLLGDRSKLEILGLLKKKRAYGTELAKALNLSGATISHHMSALLQAGLVTVEKDEKRLYYGINREAVRELLGGLEELLL